MSSGEDEQKPSILLLSGYHSDSQKAWAESLKTGLPEFTWKVLSLAPRYFSFRLRGAALSWRTELGELFSRNESAPSVIISTSSVDVSSIRAVHPELRVVPVIQYVHENQFTYPARDVRLSQSHAVRQGQPGSAEAGALSPEPAHGQEGPQAVEKLRRDAQASQLYSLLSADRILFNSAWNRDSCMEGIQRFLAALPEKTDREICTDLKRKSKVIPVTVEFPPPDSGLGLSPPDQVPGGRAEASDQLHGSRAEASDQVHGGRAAPAAAPAGGTHIHIVWPHRWEYDKNPSLLLDICRELERRVKLGERFSWSLSLLGRKFRRVPREMEQILGEFDHRIWVAAPLPRKEYIEKLKQWGVENNSAENRYADTNGRENPTEDYPAADMPGWGTPSSRHLVISTARHEFQGLSMLEAACAGLTPLVPDALSYPEYFPAACRYPVLKTEATAIPQEHQPEHIIHGIVQHILHGPTLEGLQFRDLNSGMLMPQYRDEILNLLQ